MYRFNYKFLLLMLIVCFTIEGQACFNAGGSNNEHLVVTIEGAAGRSLGSRALRLAKSLNKSNYKIISCGQVPLIPMWGGLGSGAESRIAQQIRAHKARYPNSRVTIMGHSLGGGDAVNVAAKAGVNVDDLVLFDARNGEERRCGQRGGGSYNKPANVTRVSNFYQCGGIFPGRSINGTCARNIRLGGHHINIPTAARGQVHGILNGRRPDPKRCRAVSRQLPTGIPALNAPTKFGPKIPFLSKLLRRGLKRRGTPKNIPVLGRSNCKGPSSAQIRKFNLSKSAIAKWCRPVSRCNNRSCTYGKATMLNSSR